MPNANNAIVQFGCEYYLNFLLQLQQKTFEPTVDVCCDSTQQRSSN